MLTGKLSDLGNLLSEFNDPEYELEVRFGKFSGNNFIAEVPYVYYDRFINYLNEEYQTSKKSESSEVFTYENNIRKIILSDTQEVTWQSKERITTIDIREYDIRVALSRERKINEPDNPSKVKSIRNRKRYSYFPLGKPIKIDITEIMTTENNNNKVTYEVEVEFIGNVNELRIFNDEVEKYFKILRGTENLYTIDILKKLNMDIGRLLTGDPSEIYIRKDFFTQARNIKLRDLVYGGIVGNSHIENPNLLINKTEKKVRTKNKQEIKIEGGTSYWITHKADGIRKYLIFHETGLWLVYPNNEYNLVVNGNDEYFKRFYAITNMSVFDGELTDPKINTNKTKNWFLAFDCKAYGKQSYEYFDYETRCKTFQIIKTFKHQNIVIGDKRRDEILTTDDFFRLVRSYLEDRKNLPFREDGFMFTPNNIIQNPHSELVDFIKRVLTITPDICKWKEHKDLTIDFKIRWVMIDGVKQIELMVYDEINDQDIIFNGTSRYPLTQDMIDHNNPITINEQSGRIVEYEWTTQIVDGKGKLLLRPRKIRKDKNRSNKLTVAGDVWNDINDPITAEDMKGETIKLTRRYHNILKTNLYADISKNNKHVSLLDIGSGFGGDVDKWKKYVHGEIIAVEPNPENRKELIRRVNNTTFADRVHILGIGGEKTVEITDAVKRYVPGGKVDVVSLMLSMSFFWSSDYHLDSLVETIVSNLKPGGKIIFLTIDGDRVEEIFEPKNGLKIMDKTIVTARLHLYPPISPPWRSIRTSEPQFGRPLDFWLPDTIVGEQREYLVHLKDLTERLARYGFDLGNFHQAIEKNLLLNEDNKLYTSMYTYGQYTNLNGNKLVEFHKDIILPVVPKPEDIIKVETKPLSPRVLKPIPPSETENILKKKFTPLSYLPVGKNGLNDDTYAKLNCSWFDGDVVRIATIADGSCLIHSLLKAFFVPYQNNPNFDYRVNLVAKTRRDLAVALSLENPNYPGFNYWQTVGEGTFPRMVMQELEDPNIIGINGYEFSLLGMMYLLNSKTFLGNEVYQFISEILNINIYIVRISKEDIYHQDRIYKPGRVSVVIIGNADHYEVLALHINKIQFQTVFDLEDPFLQALDSFYSKDNNNGPYDPDTTFVNNFVGTFPHSFPNQVYEVFPNSTDPFRLQLDRLLPIIKQEMK